jgi:predicted RNA binding protein YcfA (HicA-like mRNA interferase family)
MKTDAKYLVKILEQNGFVFKRAKGSHQVFYNVSTNKTVIVPMHGSKDMPKGTFYAILRQAGIDKNSL